MSEKINPLFEFVVWAIESSKKINKDILYDIVINFRIYYIAWWNQLLKEAPIHLLVETGLILFILWLVFIRRTIDPNKASRNDKLTAKEVEWLLDSWNPEPLVPALSETKQFLVDNMNVVTEYKGDSVVIEGKKEPVLNAASYDFLCFSQDPGAKKATKDTLDKYGCGSCGPRGFYGTIDQHLLFEEAIANFCGTEEAISYSDSASAVASVIPAFSKRGDFLLVDDAVYEPILSGVNLSRSTVQFFRHNDMEDLRSILESIAADDKRLRRDPTQQRRFIVVEGIYRNVGDLCPLPEIIELKKKFCYRLILDESTSFGAVGETGRGVTEYFNISRHDVEIGVVAMDTVLASVGGVCVGDRAVVDHQRLSGAGYCFSASAPPFLSAAAVAALKRMEGEPKLLANLHQVTQQLYDGLTKSCRLLQIKSDIATPLIHLELADSLETLEDEQMAVLQIVAQCMDGGIGLSASKFMPTLTNRPSVMVCAKSTFTKAQINKIVKVLAKVSSSVLDR